MSAPAAPAARPVPRTAAWLLVLWAVAVLVWWGFAFFPAPPGDDSWLAAAQAACFGSLPGGLPAASGWLMLTLAPLLMLVALLTAFQGDLRATWPGLRRSPVWRTLALVLAVLGAAEMGLAGMRVERGLRIAGTTFGPTLAEPLPADYPRVSVPVPAFTLVDQHGGAFAHTALTGEPTVLSFVFARCATVCPALERTLAAASATLGDGTRIVLVTLDPWRDTPGTLAGVVAASPLPAGARFLTGDPAAVGRLLDQLQVARARDLQTGDVSHAPLVMIVDGSGHIAYRFNNPPAEWIVEGVRRLRRGV